ncbi:phytanoyl-CoA dioxygenase family protein [Sphingorhabdus contaminans]|uniref:Phytanoyl-CoA dioxygenase family protein n=1 Tax=Sphingorhabdus contaminans TaxID=1343899 RepID=A0A553WL47_9SPHN|nr:phytanoyl-CoA dioxygenase family protein [Sphingorhabdus contaminans]TSB05435.1 phytanoyl-CoA dioxygenase family protein [Sphingorhabdus contaminans]
MDTDYDVAEIMGGIYGAGIISLVAAYDVALIDQVHRSILRLYDAARAIDGGALPRGPERWYVEVAPESIDNFVEIVSHPWFLAVSEAILGPAWSIVEVGFDIPFPGAEIQPWHRDFAAPDATLNGRRINSLAFNLTAVDTTAEMGPFEIAPGTQWDRIDECQQGMFPAPTRWQRYEARAVKKLSQRGTISARSALTVHRGTANRSGHARPVLVIGVDAPDANNSAHHDLQMTRGFFDALPDILTGRFRCRLVDEITPVRQKHVIEGLIDHPPHGY